MCMKMLHIKLGLLGNLSYIEFFDSKVYVSLWSIYMLKFYDR